MSAIAVPATAQSYVVDTGPGTPSTGVYLAGNPGVPDWTQSWHAGLFTLTTETEVSSIEAWMTVATSGAMTTAIYSADAGLPRTSPALFSVTYDLATGGPFSDWHGVSGLDWRLGPGTYWLDEEPDHTSSFLGALWLQPAAPLAHYAESVHGSTWEFDPAGQAGPDQWGLRIAGFGVPEPSTWAMMLVGFGGLGVVLRRKRTRPAMMPARAHSH